MALGNIAAIKPQIVEGETDYTDYPSAKLQYQRLIDNWKVEDNRTERNRMMRYQKGTDSQDLRNSGQLKADEMYNPIRIIDTNIRREQPQYINYLTQSRRSIIFCSEETTFVDNLEKLELDFTNKARYIGWEIPFFRCIDGAQTHGWDSVEVIFSEEYPGNFCFHHIGHENLIFAFTSEDINFQETVLVKEQLSSSQLMSLVAKKGWDEREVSSLINVSRSQGSSGQTGGQEEINIWIYKCYFKSGGAIHTAHMSPLCNNYLSSPRPLFLGVRDTTVPPQPSDIPGAPPDYPKTPETEFPITIYKYIESEDPIITNLKGRAALDEATQEAASAISSGIVNGIIRASNVYASPSPSNLNPNPSAEPKVLNIQLKHGAIYDTPLSFWSTPYPHPSTIQALQAIISQNQQEQNKIDYATTARKDSGKTATEIEAVTKQANELSSVQIILISIFIRQAYAKAWRIYQSRVLQGKIVVDPALMPLFGVVEEVPDPMWKPMPQPDLGVAGMPGVAGGMMQAPPMVRIATPTKYIIKSSGDVDVVQRAENLQRKMQAWPVMMNTPIAGEFLKDILRSAFPEDAARYIQAMDAAMMAGGDQTKVLLAQVANVLKMVVTGPDGNIKPEYAENAAQFQQLAAQVQAVLAAPSATTPEVGGPQPPQEQPPV